MRLFIAIVAFFVSLSGVSHAATVKSGPLAAPTGYPIGAGIGFSHSSSRPTGAFVEESGFIIGYFGRPGRSALFAAEEMSLERSDDGILAMVGLNSAGDMLRIILDDPSGGFMTGQISGSFAGEALLDFGSGPLSYVTSIVTANPFAVDPGTGSSSVPLPLPAGFVLLGTALGAIGLSRRRKRSL